MRLIAHIDVLEDEALQARLARLSVAALAATLVLGVACGLLTGGDGGAAATPAWWVALVVASLVALPVHELVHGAAFKLLCPGCRVTFGAQDAFLYTNAHGATASRGRMVAVLLAPAVLVTAVLVAASLAAGCPALAVLLAGAHLAGCAGDALMAADALREPACTHVRDTDVGIDLLSDAPEGAPRNL